MTALNLFWGCIIFIILVSVTFGTYCLLRRQVLSQQRNPETSLFISLTNCFACGVFLSTCFLGLLPHVREKEEHIRYVWSKIGSRSNPSSYIFLNSELIVLTGFLLMLLVEEIVHTTIPHGTSERCSQVSSNSKASRNVLNTSRSDASSLPQNSNSLPTFLACSDDTEPLVSDNLSTEDFTEEVNNMPKIEFRRITYEGHNHDGHSHFALPSTNISLGTFVLLLGLSAHSLFEGVALGIQRTASEFYSLLIAIMLHEVLCSFAFGVSLAKQKTPSKAAFISSFILSSTIPLGMLSSIAVSSMETLSAMLFRFVLEGFAAGTFIHVACIEMLSPELNTNEQSNKAGLTKVIAVISGAFVFFSLTTIFGHHSPTSILHHPATTDISSKATYLETVH